MAWHHSDDSPPITTTPHLCPHHYHHHHPILLFLPSPPHAQPHPNFRGHLLQGEKRKGAEREGGGERKEVLLAKGWRVRDGGCRETRVIRVVGVVIE